MLKQIYEALSEMHTEIEEINYVSDYLLSLKMQHNKVTKQKLKQ